MLRVVTRPGKQSLHADIKCSLSTLSSSFALKRDVDKGFCLLSELSFSSLTLSDLGSFL